MAAPALFYNPKPQFLTSTGTLANGYQLFFYQPGTTTKKDTYTTSALSVANTNPIVLNSRGESTNDIYLDGAYKVVFTSNTDSDPPVAAIWTVDNVTSLQQLLTTLSKTSNYTVTVADKDKFILCDATTGTITLTLPTAASAGDGFSISVKKIDSSSNIVNLDANGAETIDGRTTYPLTGVGHSVNIVSNGTTWYVRNSSLVANAASTVNNITITNAATGSGPSIAPTGSDTNIPVTLSGKGTGKVALGQATSAEVQLVADQPITDSSGNEYLKFSKTATAVNELTVTNAATATNPKVSATGGDTNIGIEYLTKGTGQHIVNYEDSRTNTVINPQIVRATTTGTPAAAIGVGTLYQAESADETPSDAGALNFQYDVVTSGAEQTNFGLALRTSGAALSSAFIWRRTAGSSSHTWQGSASSSRLIVLPDSDIVQHIVQRVNTQTGAVSTGTTTIPLDDTIPQITEGDQYMTLAITPKSASNILYIDVVYFGSHNTTNSQSTVALFQDATANALAVGYQFNSTAGTANGVKFTHKMTAGTTSSTTFRVRAGSAVAGTTTFNGVAAARLFGGVFASSITITEVSA